MFSPEELDNWFTYHTPTPEQIPKYQRIRDKAKEFAEMINEDCPDGADKSAAMRKLRDLVMAANLSIACGK